MMRKILKRLADWCQREWYNVRYLKGRPGLLLVWPVLGAVVLASLGFFAHSSLENQKHDLQERLCQEAATLAEFYGTQMARSLEKIEELSLYIQHDWEVSGGSVDLAALARYGLFHPDRFYSFLIVGPTGKALTSTMPAALGVTFSDRPYFQYHSTHADKSLRIGFPSVGRISFKKVVHLTRRLERNNRFDGVLVIGMPVDFFQPLSAESSLGFEGLLGLVGEGDVLHVSSKGNTPDTLGHSSFRRIPSLDTTQRGALVEGSYFDDGKPRIVASARIPGYPYRAIVALSESEKMGPLQEAKANVRNAAISTILLVASFVLIAMQLSARLIIRREKEQELQDSYRTATEMGQECFYLWRFVRDVSGEVIDFRLADCNERGAALYGLTREKMIGILLSAVYPNVYGEMLFKTFMHGYNTGYAEDSFKVPAESRVKADWVNRKILRVYEGISQTLRDISESQRREADMIHLATHDTLTSLPNRYWLTQTLPVILERARATETQVAVLFIDLDNFKNVNDTLGHSAGDELLTFAASRLCSVVRPTDSVVRIGGDEFTIILDPAANPCAVAEVANRIIEAFKAPFELSTSHNAVGASIGISMFPTDGTEAETLLKCADIAMYSAKGTKNSFIFFENSLFERFSTRLRIEEELRLAVARDEFVVHYQPRVQALDSRLVGFEALVRWNHPVRGLILPGEFIPIAESSDLILGIGKAVAKKVSEQIAKWKDAGMKVVPVSINVSARQFNRMDVAGMVADCLSRNCLPAALLEIELTESAMMDEEGDVLNELYNLERVGVKIHVDDFGTGYSSLALLQRLRVDVLKIDRAFTSRLCTSTDGQVFVNAIITMAHALGMCVVAEGVETMEQMRILKEMRCDEIQGFYISKPVPPEVVPLFLEKHVLGFVHNA